MAYFALQCALRLAASSSIALDEGQQLVWAQDLRWGYGSHPPLYTWLQACVFRLLGTSLSSVVVLKFGILLAIFLLLLRTARTLVGDERLSVLAAVSLVLVPEIAWGSLADRSHSLLACAMAILTLLAGLKLRGDGAATHALFGLSAALGILSKYNFAVFLVPFLGAGLTLEPYRRAFLDRRMLLAAAVFLAVLLPHAIWAGSRPDVLLEESGELLARGATGALAVRAAGVWSLLRAIVGLVGPLIAVYLVVCRNAGGEAQVARGGTEETLLRRTFLGAIALCLVTVVATGFRVRDRWLLPALFAVPIALVVRFRPRLTVRRTRILAGLAATVFLGTLVGAPLVLRHMEYGSEHRIRAPGEEVLRAIRARVESPGTIVAHSLVTGAHLRLAYPGARILAPGAPLPARRPPGPWLVVWDATRDAAPPEAVVKIAGEELGIDLCRLPPELVEGPYRWAPAGPSRFAFVR